MVSFPIGVLIVIITIGVLAVLFHTLESIKWYYGVGRGLIRNGIHSVSVTIHANDGTIIRAETTLYESEFDALKEYQRESALCNNTTTRKVVYTPRVTLSYDKKKKHDFLWG